MNKRLKYIGLGIFLLLISKSAISQFSFSGEFRPRTEVRGGYKAPLVSLRNTAVVTDQRTRIYMGYRKDNVDMKFTVQDIRLWGGAPLVGGNGSSLGIAESWLKLTLKPNINLKVGRQPISLDNERIFGALNWAQAGRFHDALTFNIHSKEKAQWNNQLKFIASLNQSSSVLSKTRYGTQGSYKGLFGTYFKWANKSSGANGSFLSSYVLYPREYHNLFPPTTTDTFNYGVGTHGLTANGKLLGFKMGVEGYVQHDIRKVGTEFLGAAYISKSWNLVTVKFGGDWLSSRFNPAFGTNHKFYGFMDYFYVGNAHQEKGLFNPHLRFNLKIKESNLSIIGHHFRSVTNIPTGDEWKSMGEEIDLLWSKKFTNAIHILAGWSLMRRTSFLNEIKNVKSSPKLQTWGFIQLTYKPKFI